MIKLAVKALTETIANRDAVLSSTDGKGGAS